MQSSLLVLFVALLLCFGTLINGQSSSSSSSAAAASSSSAPSSSSSAAAASSSSSSSTGGVASSSSSSSSGAASSSSSMSFSSSSSSSSSNPFYNGNEPSYPGCYLCPAITQCAAVNVSGVNTTAYNAFSIVATTSAAADSASCGAITNDILAEVTQYAPNATCVQQIGYLACFGAGYQMNDCRHPIAPQWPALCEQFTACLAPAGQAFIQQAGLCTNITGFLNRPVSIGSLSSSSSTGVNGTGYNGAAGSASFVSAALYLAVLASAAMMLA